MKAGRFVGPRKVEILEAPLPPLGESEVRFKIEASCLCGSDMPLFRNDFDHLKREGNHLVTHYIDYTWESFYPMDIGLSLHECVGTVTESRSSRFQVGDFVLGVPVHQHGFFEYLTLHEERIYPMPDGIVSKEEILMSQPLGTVIFGFRKLPDVAGKSVVVLGQGPIGLLMDGLLKKKGASQIIGIDPLGYRAETGRQMGATQVVDSSKKNPLECVREWTGSAGPEIVIEAAGHHELALDLATELVAHDGHILQFGVPDDNVVPVAIKKLFYKNISLHHSVGAYYEKDFVEAARMIAEGEIDVKPLLTHRFKLDKVQQAYETYADRLDGSLKVLLDFS